MTHKPPHSPHNDDEEDDIHFCTRGRVTHAPQAESTLLIWINSMDFSFVFFFYFALFSHFDAHAVTILSFIVDEKHRKILVNIIDAVINIKKKKTEQKKGKDVSFTVRVLCSFSFSLVRAFSLFPIFATLFYYYNIIIVRLPRVSRLCWARSADSMYRNQLWWLTIP